MENVSLCQPASAATNSPCEVREAACACHWRVYLPCRVPAHKHFVQVQGDDWPLVLLCRRHGVAGGRVSTAKPAQRAMLRLILMPECAGEMYCSAPTAPQTSSHVHEVQEVVTGFLALWGLAVAQIPPLVVQLRHEFLQSSGVRGIHDQHI